MWSAVPTKPEFVKNVPFMPCAASIFSILNWSALLSSNPIVTTVFVPAACASCAGTVDTGASSKTAPDRISPSRVLVLIPIASLSADAGGLPRERERRARREIDRGLHRGIGLHVVLVDRSVPVERRERVDAVGRTRAHVAQGAVCGEGVRPLHRGAGEDRRRAVEGSGDVRYLV